MPRLLLPLLLLLTACGTAAPDGERPTTAACQQPPPAPGPVLLQEPPRDVTGPFYAARTDGPCGLLVTFVGAPEGDGPCLVAEYAGRLEPAGTGLRLVVDERHTGPTPSGVVGCNDLGAHRSMHVPLDEPLDGRRVVDAQGHALHLVDGAQLLRPGALPDGWSVGPEGTNPGLPAHWSAALRAPGLSGELRQGGVDLVDSVRDGFGYQRVEARTVRETQAELGRYADPSGNHVLTWVEGERGFVLQVLGGLQDADVLVEVADGLDA